MNKDLIKVVVYSAIAFVFFAAAIGAAFICKRFEMPEYYQAILTGLTSVGSFLMGLLVKEGYKRLTAAVVLGGIAASLSLGGCNKVHVDPDCALDAAVKCAKEMQRCMEPPEEDQGEQ